MRSLMELAAMIGKESSITLENGLTIAVEIKDARKAFGRDDIKVRPVAGHGEAWVDAARLCGVLDPQLPR